MIGGILLAAGRGVRSGADNKLLVRDRHGVGMACRSAMALERSRVDRVCVVLGHQAEQVRASIEQECPGLPALLSPAYADGLAASLAVGIGAAVRDGWEAAVVCLADMPLVGADIIDRLIAAYREASGRADAVVPLAAGRRGNPVLWDARLFPSLSALRGDRGGRDLLGDPDMSVLAVETGDEAVLTDYDTPRMLAVYASKLDSESPCSSPPNQASAAAGPEGRPIVACP